METRYERRLNYNWVTRFLHNVRYRYLEEVVRNFKTSKEQIRIVDIGSGTCKAFSILNKVRSIDYVGIELRRKMCREAQSRYGDFTNFQIINGSVFEQVELFADADIVIALEVLEHIYEHEAEALIREIGSSDVATFFCTVPNEVGPGLALKNIGSALIGYSRHREYSWRDTYLASTYQLHRMDPHATKHKGFDWRRLERSLRSAMIIDRIITSPYGFMPTIFSPTVGFVCRPTTKP
jgi:hypothetical protein